MSVLNFPLTPVQHRSLALEGQHLVSFLAVGDDEVCERVQGFAKKLRAEEVCRHADVVDALQPNTAASSAKQKAN